MKTAAVHNEPIYLYERINWNHPTAPTSAEGILTRITTACARGRQPHQTITENERTTAAGIVLVPRDYTEEELRHYFKGPFTWLEKHRLAFSLESVKMWRKAHFLQLPTPLGLGIVGKQQNDIVWIATYEQVVSAQHGLGIGAFSHAVFNIHQLPLTEGGHVVVHDRVITDMVYLHTPDLH